MGLPQQRQFKFGMQIDHGSCWPNQLVITDKCTLMGAWWSESRDSFKFCKVISNKLAFSALKLLVGYQEEYPAV